MLEDQLICQTDPDLWFSDSYEGRLIASDLCSSCPFLEECKILGEKESFGVWGGVDRTGLEVPVIKTCRSGRHEKKSPGTCVPCRQESQASYYKKNATVINRKKQQNHPHIKKRKNVEGGYCVNGHKLEGTNILIRSTDKALLCKKCIHGNKVTIIPASDPKVIFA